MKTVFFALSLLLAASGFTQSSTTKVTESETAEGYFFSVSQSSAEKQELIRAFTKATGQTLLGTFSGDWEETNELGVETAMNTRRNRITVRYEGDSPEAIADAKQQVSAIRRILELPETPVPPTPNKR